MAPYFITIDLHIPLQQTVIGLFGTSQRSVKTLKSIGILFPLRKVQELFTFVDLFPTQYLQSKISLLIVVSTERRVTDVWSGASVVC